MHRGIKIFHQNVSGLLTNIDKVKILLRDFKNIDLLTLSETHINDDIYNDNARLYEVSSFKFIHRNRKYDTHGGVTMHVSNKIQFDRRKDLEENMLECIWIEIYVRKSQNYLIGTIYQPPDGSDYLPTCFNNSLHNMLSNVITKSREVTLLGDTNVNYLKKNDNLAIKNIFHLYSFQQIVTKPTRITEYSKTIIDTIFTTNAPTISAHDVIPTSIVDHDMVGHVRKIKNFFTKLYEIAVQTPYGKQRRIVIKTF